MQKLRYPLIAFTGYARSGKDEAAKPLIAAGYNRVAFGDIIKAQCDSMVRQHLGFSAFTEVDSEKVQIRRTLQYWGEDNYENIFREFFERLTPPAVNTRLCRLREAEEWVRRGGILVNVTRPGVGPETPWSQEINAAIRGSGLIHTTIDNCGTIEQLYEAVRALLL